VCVCVCVRVFVCGVRVCVRVCVFVHVCESVIQSAPISRADSEILIAPIAVRV